MGDARGFWRHDAAVVYVNYVTLGRLTLSPAGGFGRGLWEGSWQAAWSGRLQNELTHIRRASTAGPRSIAQSSAWPPGTSAGRSDARVRAPMAGHPPHLDRAGRPVRTSHGRVRRPIRNINASHLENLRQRLARPPFRRLARGVFLLWAGEIPFRYSDINRLPALVIRLCWLIQAPHFYRRGRRRARARPREPPRRPLAAGGADCLCNCGPLSASSPRRASHSCTAGFASFLPLSGPPGS